MDLNMKNAFGKLSTGIITAAMAAAIILTAKTSAKAAQQIDLNKEYSADLGAGLDYEYKFKAPDSGSFHIETEFTVSDKENANYCSVRAKFTKDENEYWNEYIKVDGKSASSEYSFKPGQEFTLKFDCVIYAYSPKKKYDLKFKVVTDNPQNFEIEDNNTASHANKIKAKKVYKGILNAEDEDADWYVFKAPKTGKYRFYVNNTSNTGRSASFQVYGYKSKKKLDAKNSATLIEGCGSFKSKKISLKKGKKYYIKIEKAHPCNASYDLKIKKVK